MIWWLIFWVVVGGGFALLLFRARHGWGTRTKYWQDEQPEAYAAAWLARLRRGSGRDL
ncbi:MAG: hypothetical protein ACXWX6_10735 [Actinomycetota bacterium]